MLLMTASVPCSLYIYLIGKLVSQLHLICLHRRS
jgi:hypothetical protein